MKIGIDIMGGDYAPQSALEGIKDVSASLPKDINLTLIGREETVEEFCSKNKISKNGFEIVEASQVIGMSESPTKAFSNKPDSTIGKGLQLLRDNQIDIFLSAGNTGAVLVGSLYTIQAIKGVMRPTITTLVPKVNGGYGIMLDVGANADCKPETLFQFGILGSIYARNVYKIEKPKVGLLSIGSEREKGNLVTQAAYPLMENSDKINFIGNIEGYDLFGDKADVIVTDGFTGNIVLKSAEAIYSIMKSRGIKDNYFDKYDYENYGGTPILGVNKPVIIGHGVSSPIAFKNMILLAKDVIESKLTEKIKLAFEL